MARHIVCLSFDFDTMSAYIARGQTSPSKMSEGEFGIRAAERLMRLLGDHGIGSTWFAPGFTVETYPGVCAAIAEAGHEIGHHGWNHIAPADLSRQAERDELWRANEAIARVAGKPASGYRSPSWDLSPHTIDLLIEAGFVYDSSMMADDYAAYFARQGDEAVLDNAYAFGAPSALVEMPISWSLDDAPHFKFTPGARNVNQGLRPPRQVMAGWLDEFRYMARACQSGIMTITMHPHVIGRGMRMIALEELIEALKALGAVFLTMEAAALEARARLSAEASG